MGFVCGLHSQRLGMEVVLYSSLSNRVGDDKTHMSKQDSCGDGAFRISPLHLTARIYQINISVQMTPAKWRL